MTNDVVELVTPEDENRILQLRLSGMSVRRLAREFKLRETEIIRILDAALPPLNQATKIRLFREDIARLDDLLIAFYPEARKGNVASAGICLKLLERRAAMVGMDSPVRIDISAEAVAAETPRSTAALIEELDRIVAERQRPAHDLRIDHDPLYPPVDDG
jgi:hypothetical protein